MTISLCIIVKNEAAGLARLLPIVDPHVTEVVIVDTGSTDGTYKHYLQSHLHYANLQYILHGWDNNFSTVRNFAISQASGTHLLFLDGHDVVTPQFMNKINDLVFGATPPDVISAPYYTSFDEQGNPTSVIPSLPRVVAKSAKPCWIGAVHEYLTTTLCYSHDLDIPVLHKPFHENGCNYLDLLVKEVSLNPRNARTQYYLGREYYAASLYETAIYHLKLCVDRSHWFPEITSALTYIARCQLALDSSKEALATCLQAVKRDHSSVDAVFLMGCILYDLGRWEDAVIWFLKCRIMKSPDYNFVIDPTLQTYKPSMYLPKCYFHLDEYELGLAEARYHLHCLPNDPIAQKNVDLFSKIISRRIDTLEFDLEKGWFDPSGESTA